MARIKEKVSPAQERDVKSQFDIRFIDDVFGAGASVLADVLRTATGSQEPRVLLVADSNVVQRTEGLGKKIGVCFRDFNIKLVANPVILAGGEKIKSDNFQSVSNLTTVALESKIGANDVIIALGGGAVLDVAGYVASQVRGGVKLIRMPTTPAAMFDGVFAEMAAINVQSVKDALRVSSKPYCSIVDSTFAQTVLDGVWWGGVGEIMRYAAVLDSALAKKFAKNAEKLKKRDMSVFVDLLLTAIESRLKKGGTQFALWSAKRLESMSAYKLPHGYAVPIGVCIDCAYAVAKGVMKETDQELVCRALADCGALEGLVHSHHLLSQPDTILFGLDAWCLSTGAQTINLPSQLGKMTSEEKPDKELFKKVIKEFLAVSSAED